MWSLQRCAALALTGLGLMASMTRAQLVNPGFETNDLTGWTASDPVNASVVGSHTDAAGGTVLPFSGSSMAQIFSQGLDINTLTANLGISPADLTSSGPVEGAYLSTVASLTAGESVTFAWLFSAFDEAPFDDAAFLVVSGPLLTQVTHLTGVVTGGGVPAVGNYGQSGWATVTFVASLTGNYTFSFLAVNGGDVGFNSALLVDASTFTPVPEASTYGLLAAALLTGAVVWRRRGAR